LATLLIGDFRGKQLQQLKNSNDYTFIVDDRADCSWLSSGVAPQLPLYSLDKANVVITLGFNDCVYSCVWETFKLDEIINDYITTINKLIEDYPSFTFYVCSINPIDSGYPFAEHNNGLIQQSVLDKKIKLFNTKVKETCAATFINCYNYLTSTGFSTRDGVRYTADTCNSVLSYIDSHLENLGGTLFKPRLTAPVVNSDDIESDLYWISTQYGGLNPFPLPVEHSKSAGDTLPNCTAYAWGRFYELLGSEPTLSLDNAEYWFLKDGKHGYGNDGYSRGTTPALGAIMCWQNGDIGNDPDVDGSDAGHVAVVEQINPDGSIVTSESGWRSASYWWTKTRTKGADGNWDGGTNYKFQGFIYCPTTSTITKDEIRSDNSWSVFTVDDHMKTNAKYIWQYFGARGWTMNAVAGLLGNLQSESGMSPGIWESIVEGSIIKADGTHELNSAVLDSYKATNGRYPGYGLVQWTPYTKYTDWCKKDGRNLNFWEMDSQLERINWEAENRYQWALPDYNKNFEYKGKNFADLTFKNFISSTESAGWLAAAFAFCYERPASSVPKNGERDTLAATRAKRGENWYSFLNSLPPISADKSIAIEDVRVVELGSTHIQVAFLARNVKKASFALDDKAPSDLIELSEDFVKFDVNNLIPNKNYTLSLVAEGDGETKIIKKLSFKTLQSFPESIKKIELAAKDAKLPNDTLQLTTSPSQPDFGYWGTTENKNCGYTIQLIVNGNIKKEKEVGSLPKTFTISAYFNHKVKVGDIIQIGIRTWVKDDVGKKVYDSNFVKASNSICMIVKPVVAYLNID
jgi:surface antigen